MPSEQKIIVIPDGKICDYIDGKFRNDTPEEYVRQTIEKRLVNEHKYLPEQIRIEYTLQVGSNKPRADIVIWEEGADQTQGTIKLIIECKKETVDARNAKDGIAQLKSYMSVCPNCEWGMWTNSVQKYVFRKAVDAAGNITFMEYNDIPAADGNLDEVNRPSRTSLKNAYDDNLLFVFKTCHTRSGTIGKITIVPKHWEHYIPSDHIIRVIPANKDIAGYLNIFLASDYGKVLITRFTYGSVVDEIDDNHVRQIAIPLLKNHTVQKKINDLALEANEKRYQAYLLEQEALQIMDRDVIYAKK